MAARTRKNAGADAPERVDGVVEQAGATVDYEAAMARLQEVVAALEAGDLPLERSVALYKEGLGLSRACRDRLRTARNEIRLFTEGGLKDFEGVGDDADAE
ncbi:exodeoxyribonuclease VII small subunit [Desulfovibrio oxamicus]|uniref:Exodeoxyribonuclease 7 small subunit n=1 Tax=Nitratidesulfovibrio oxamicus TaxID=32016 RepID=A0ABS0J8M8_9BACT|nr:exodeoxyribonuclease VII small subunit [Nitratidesulfovibrio oxamicus]MBG3878487.1 exodeoxyribonuclease VII small subunit [Nitratidesulfovibrio oxamicus]